MTPVETSQQGNRIDNRMIGVGFEWQLDNTNQQIARLMPLSKHALPDLAAAAGWMWLQ